MAIVKFPSIRRGFLQTTQELARQDRRIAAELTAVTADQDHVDNRVALGAASGTYSNWSHVEAFDGYGIWKISNAATYDTRAALYSLDRSREIERAYENMGQAMTAGDETFDAVWLHSGGSFTSYTTEAASDLGTPFNARLHAPSLPAGSGSLYLGYGTGTSPTPRYFQGISVTVQIPGVNYGIVVEYWDGSQWTSGVTVALQDDQTSGLASKGVIEFDIDTADWEATTVNSQSGTWIRLRTSSEPETFASIYSMRPASGVGDLLLRSSEQLRNQQYAWTTFNSESYVTIPNAGPPQREGIDFLKAGSSATLRRNFFAGWHRHFYVQAVSGSATLLPTTTKGDLIVHNGSTNVRLGVGTDGQVLTAYAASGEGIAWGAAVGVGGGDPTVSGSLPAYKSGSATFYTKWSSMPADPLSSNLASMFMVTDVPGSPDSIRLAVKSGDGASPRYYYVDLNMYEVP